MKKYTVVLFTESNEPAVIPSLWLSNKEDGQWCYFPPSSLSDARFNRAVIDCLDPDNSWEEFKCRKLYESGDYDRYFYNRLCIFMLLMYSLQGTQLRNITTGIKVNYALQPLAVSQSGLLYSKALGM